MKKLTLSMFVIAACSLSVSSAFAQDFSLGNIADAILRGPGRGGDHGGDGRGGRGGDGRGGDHRGPGHGNPGHGGGNGGGNGPGWGGGNGPGHGGPGHGGPGHGGPGYPGNPGGHPRQVILTCVSGGYNFNRCFVRGRVFRADLVRQRSQSACILGRTWGYDSQSVWVDRGCKGDFAVRVGF